jgi:hypothetical protein
MVVSEYIFGHRPTLAPLSHLVMSECLMIGVSTLNLTISQREIKYATGIFPFHVSFSHLCKILHKKLWLVIRGREPGLNLNWGELGKITAQP